ncbi:MAG: division/cell wall cluster transcriptional repressor MraZ [Anaerolineaceae bacterium]|nr:division/cell wall cluster transcriptional repressor MraZ [Anaerolineaceae bacterium]
MFMGQYEHNIDTKGRLTIPARFREFLANGAYVTQGLDNNLMVLTNDDFMRVTQHINQMSLTNPIARQLKRRIFAYAEQIIPDKLGRILIPAFLREAAKLDGSVEIVGVGAYFEIWSPDLWAKQIAEIQNPEADAQRFAIFDLPLG